MSIEKETRLNKVAKELSVGVSTIVDFLKRKGFTVDNSPNAKITPKQYELLQREYASDQMAKKLSEKEAEIEKERRRAINAENKANKAANTNQVSSSDKKETKVSDSNQRQNNNQRSQNQQKNNDRHRQKYQEPTIPKVIGKIDLSAINTKTRPDKKSSSGQDKGSSQPRPETQQKNSQPNPSATTTAAQQPAQPTQPAAPASTPTSTTTSAPASAPQTDSTEIFRPGSIQLTGPKVLGKIELEDSKRKRKKKRRRIDKERVDINESAQLDKKDKKDNSRKNRKDGKSDDKQQGGGGKNKQQDAKEGKSGKRNKDRRQQNLQEVSDEEVNKQVKETLAKLTRGKGKNKAAIRRHDERMQNRLEEEAQQKREQLEKKTLQVTEFISANELASLMDVQVNQVISSCFDLGYMVAINQRLDAEVISTVASAYGFDVNFISEETEDDKKDVVEDKPEDLQPRAPIVVVMGHVDHGKTKLLDYIRKTNVISGEAGGITQAIGAYNVTLPDGRHITFLDTPGHQAFTAMRARGAKVTDVAVIVVAADSTVMPQTEEAIAHAQAAGVPIVFAITKTDLPTANVEKIKEELAKRNFLVEDWGGGYGCVEISAVTGHNVDELLERIMLEAEMLDLKANFNCQAEGTVVESTLDKGRGYMATVLVQRGTLKVGDVLWAGSHSGKIRAMFNERGKNIKEVRPGEPASVLGLDGSPIAGDKFEVMKDERTAREKAARHEQLAREISFRTKKHLTLEEIARRIKLGNFKELNIVLKADVQGSVEALQDSLEKLSTEEIQVNILFKGVGQISENDVMLATASDAIIIGFEVRPSANAKRLAEKDQVQIKTYSVIYDAINDIQDAMKGMLAPETKIEINGSAEVKSIFKIAKVGNIAGCLVTEGKVLRTSSVNVIREGVVVFKKGKIAALKHYKDDAKEINMGMECGIFIENYNEFQVGDIIEAYEEKVVER